MFRATKAMKAVGTILSAGLLMGFALLQWAASMPGGGFPLYEAGIGQGMEPARQPLSRR